MPAKRALIMHPSDNVATAVEEIQPGDSVAVPVGREILSLQATEPIPFGFKIALQEIPHGGIIRKYGETIGKASVLIAKGAMVHIHNLEGTRARGDLERSRDELLRVRPTRWIRRHP
jgi:altronate dehydratase small subunit